MCVVEVLAELAEVEHDSQDSASQCPTVPLPHGRLIPAPGIILLVILSHPDNYDILGLLRKYIH